MTNPSTSAEQIIRQAKDLGCEILRSDSHVLIVKLAAGRDLTVKFDRSGRIREAAYDRDGIPTVRRAIRPARVGAVLGVLFSEVYDAVHKNRGDPRDRARAVPPRASDRLRPERADDHPGLARPTSRTRRSGSIGPRARSSRRASITSAPAQSVTALSSSRLPDLRRARDRPGARCAGSRSRGDPARAERAAR